MLTKILVNNSNNSNDYIKGAIELNLVEVGKNIRIVVEKTHNINTFRD